MEPSRGPDGHPPLWSIADVGLTWGATGHPERHNPLIERHRDLQLVTSLFVPFVFLFCFLLTSGLCQLGTHSVDYFCPIIIYMASIYYCAR